MTLQSLIYLSSGNLPSKWAHSIQIAKMSQAYAKQVPQFELVTSGNWRSTFRGMDDQFMQWYCLHHPYKLVRIPAHLRVTYPFPPDYFSLRYCKLAALYGGLKAPDFIKTRSYTIAKLLLEMGLPVLWERHEPIDPDSPHASLFAYPNLLGVVTLSASLAKDYVEHGLPESKAFVAPSAVDLEPFLPHRSQAAARQELSLPQDANILVYSGHLYDYKGIPTLLKTAALLPNCLLILVGGWEEDVRRVQAECRSAGLTNVQFTGHLPQSQMISYLYAADVLLLPTSRSWRLAEVTSPLKLFEYMAVNRPIVASNLPNITSVLRDRINALVAEPDDPLALKTAITELLEKPDLACSIAHTAYQEVQHHTWDNRARNILNSVEGVLQSAPVTSPNLNNRMTHYLKAVNAIA